MASSAHPVRVLAIAIATFAPTLGCSPHAEDPPYLFGVTEMRAVGEGKWVGTLGEGADGTAAELTLSRVDTLSPACGSRTLSGSDLGVQCIGPTSSMTFAGTFTSADGAFTAAEVRADFMVYGSIVENGEMGITFVGRPDTRAQLPFRKGTFEAGSLSVGPTSRPLVVTKP